MQRYPDAVILVFCKAPVPGQVKTRLIPQLTPEEATQLHRELTEKTLQTVTQNNLCDVQLWGFPTINDPYFNELREKYHLSLMLQQGEDLGARMHHALTNALNGYQSAVLIGCDCPSLTNDDLQQALDGLQSGNNCVIAPAEDGGYVLVGLNQPQPVLFTDMPWGTTQVMGLTCQKIHSLDLAYHELATQWDVDTIEGLSRYRAFLPLK